LIAQIGIIVSGGLVRLTGSGLGCPTWPECVDGSLVPTERQEESWHKMIEFGNRLLTFVLTALAIAAIVGALSWARRRKRNGLPARPTITWLATIPLVGTFAQAILGGITVLTGLHPAIVAAHFLLSIAIVAGCVVLVERSHSLTDQPVRTLVRPEVKWLANTLVALAALVIIIGTVVSGSGPNSGDADVINRFGFDQRLVAWLHADVVLLFVGLVLGMVLILRLLNGPKIAVRRAWYLVAAVLASGSVGYFQLFTGLPWAAVATHMLLAALLWVATLRLRLAMTARGSSPSQETDIIDLDKQPVSAV
jgi:cytochrome c oxidase assembly protein subunit 15